MINSVTSNTQIAQTHQAQQHQQNVQARKTNQKEPQDTVVLSKHASGTVDADHDGDSH